MLFLLVDLMLCSTSHSVKDVQARYFRRTRQRLVGTIDDRNQLCVVLKFFGQIQEGIPSRTKLTFMHLVAISVSLVILEADKRFAWTTSLRRISNSCQGGQHKKNHTKKIQPTSTPDISVGRSLAGAKEVSFRFRDVIWGSRASLAILKASGGRRR